ncbi:MAG: hypothetical protein GVY26_04145, partial [Bacteroidetes bacterium]|nr:hypothetical protein [Bacteroidota bacterium]
MSQTQHCHPLDNLGTSQIGRLIQALMPETFQIDERSIQDLIVEAHKFAKTLHFYDGATNQPSGSYWEGFWEVEILTYLAVLSVKDTDAQLNNYRGLVDAFKMGRPAGKKGDEAPSPYLPLLEQLRNMAVELEQSYQKLQRINHPLQDLLLHRIRRENATDREELEGALTRLISYHKGAVDELAPQLYEAFLLADGRWGLRGRVDYDAISAQPNFNLEALEAIFTSFYDTWLILKTEAQKSFDTELARMERPQAEEYRVVQPHIALFLVFLRLFRYAQESLNELGAKHLNYYYQEILGINAQDAVPDEVYLIFELAKDFNEHVLEKGTPLLGGKDANGRPLIYRTAKDWVVRAAQVADIKTTWIDSRCGGIHAQPDVKTVYRLGEALPNETAESWRAMGDDPHLPTAEIGFAIASPQLILREGERDITVVLQLCQPLPDVADIRADYFKVYLSAAEEWVSLVPDTSVDADSARGKFDITFSGQQMQLHIKLERDAPPIDRLGEDLAAAAGMDTRWPILKLVINPELKKPCPVEPSAPLTAAEVYGKLQALVVEEATITVDVKGMRENLIIQSDQGVFDGTQKVYPFGPTPQIGNRFYIGSTEVFQKALDDLVVRFKWIAPPESFPAYYAGYSFLNPNLYPTPNPQMLIEFVDRAEEEQILLNQVVRTGVNGSSSGLIRMKVSDVNLNGLGGIEMENSNSEPELEELEDGEYTLESGSWEGVTLTLLMKKVEDGNVEPDFEPLELSVVDKQGVVPANLEIVLFPLLQRFQPISENIIVKGYFRNIYGEALYQEGGMMTVDGNTATALQNAFEYELPGKEWPSGLAFDVDGQGKVVISNPRKFLTFSAVLPLKGSVQDDDTGLRITGAQALSGLVTNGAIADPQPLSGVEVAVKGESDALLIATKTRADGSFVIPQMVGEPEEVAFSYEDGGADPLTTNKLTGALEVTFYPKPIQKLPPEGNLTVKGIITLRDSKEIDYEDPSTLDIMIISGSGRWSITSEGDSFEVEGVDVAPNSVLKISREGFQTVQCSIERFTDLEVELLPEDFEIDPKSPRVTGKVYKNAEMNGTTGNKVSIDVMDMVGNPLDNTTVAIMNELAYQGLDDSDALYYELKTDENGRVEFYPPATSSYYIKAVRKIKEGIFEITEAESGSIGPGDGYNVKLVVGNIKKSIPLSSTVNGIVRSTDGDLLEDVKVSPVGKDDEAVYTDARGGFRINVEEGDRLWFYHPSYESVSSGVLLENYEVEATMTPRAAFYVIEGEVQDIYKAPLSKAAISISPEALTVEEVDSEENRPNMFKIGESGAGGFYRLDIPIIETSDSGARAVRRRSVAQNGIRTLIFQREGYKTVVLSFPPDDQSNTINRSYMEVRMRYNEIDYRPLVVNDTMQGEFDVKINALSVERDIRTQHFERYSPTLKRGFLRFTLEKDDFRHEAYPRVLTLSSLKLAEESNSGPVLHATANVNRFFIPANCVIQTQNNIIKELAQYYNRDLDVTDYLPPNPPYTPATNNISLDYTSTQVITGAANDGIDQFYHLLPFNGHRAVPLASKNADTAYKGTPLIYPYTPADSIAFRQVVDCGNNGQAIAATTHAEGHLYIGLSGLTPGGTLSLLFTVAKGSAPAPEALAPELCWSYLSADNRWLPFQPGEVLKDTTNGLTRTGLMQFQIPTTAVRENTMLNPELYWIRAAAKPNDENAPATDVRALPSLAGIHAQAVLAQFADEGNELSHLGASLPAGTISNLVQGNIAVKKITQPLPSFGGRLPEQAGDDFIRRVSERLRHKDRAVSRWDYEHLLLQAFDEVQRAKCIPHTRYHPWEKASESAPGFVSVAVIPRLDGRTGHALAEPRFTQGKLDDMAAHLAQRANLFVAFGEKAEARLQVVNPLYERVDVKVKVAFHAGDEVYFKQQLTEALTHYISPWLADNSTPPVFGRVLDKSAMLQFIEEQPYVDYVALGPGDFVIRKILTDLAGRPLADIERRTLEARVHGTATEVDVYTLQSREIDDKICPRTERSILIAGTVYVNSTKDNEPKDLPAPRQIVKEPKPNGKGSRTPKEEPAQDPVVAVR